MIRRNRESQPNDVTALVDQLVRGNIADGATDIHFEPVDRGLLIRARVDGQLLDRQLIPRELATNVVSRLKILAGLLTYRIDVPQEGSVRWLGGQLRTVKDHPDDPVDLRIATMPTIRGERAAIRILRKTPQLMSLEALGLQSDQLSILRSALARPVGLVVLSGPAGSGKTTTLYGMIREIGRRYPSRSVMTLEDPVEQRIDGIAQIQINPHGEMDYGRSLRSLLRHDPQVILLGEVRDRPTAMAAVEAALTGHLILTTVHSGEPAETVVRFLEMGIPAYQLTSVLSVICSQRLLRRICTTCRRDSATDDDCVTCLGTGYSGRTAIAQVIRIDESAQEGILANERASQLRIRFQRQSPDLLCRAEEACRVGISDSKEVERVLGISTSQVASSRVRHHEPV
ncbi:MAG: GspE/PulE family protein [Planctomycetota bacterium]